MIQTTDEFHQVANGQVRPLDWEAAIAFQKSSSEPYEIEGSLSQAHTYSGKNMFDKNGTTTTSNATWTVSGESIKVTEAASFANARIDIAIPNSENLLGKTVTLSVGSAVSAGGATGPRIIVFDNKFSTAYTTLRPTSSVKSATFTLPTAFPSTSTGFVVSLYVNSANSGGAIGANTTYTNVQIEIGSTATPYEPYVGGVPSPSPYVPEPITTKTGNIIVSHDGHSYPISLGDIELAEYEGVADRIFMDEGVWKIEKNIEKVVLDENSGCYLYTGRQDEGFRIFRAPVADSLNTHVISSHFENKYRNWADLNNIHLELTQLYTNNALYIKIKSSRADNIEQFNSWLSVNRPVFYFVKLTPTYEAITDENLLTQLNAPLQPRPEYLDVKNRTISISTSRSVEFPHTVQSATCDLELDNHDKKFSYSNHSELGPYILPNRSMAIELGFKEVGTVPHFYGNTIMPKYQGEFEEVATFTANDDLSKLGENHLPNMIMLRDVRTDEAIEAILIDLGVPSDKYELEEGANRIPFVYFDADKSVGNALKELVQAENGALWQDEKGIIRFAARNTNAFSQDPVMIFDKTNTIAVEPSHVDNIVNSVSITADIRKVESRQQIFTADNANGYQSEAAEDNYRVAANGSISIWLSLDDPTWTCSNPVLNGSSDSSTFTAVDLSGNEVSSNVSATGTLFATSYKVDFINTNSFPVSINQITLWGEPAKLIGGQAVEYFATDDDSVSKFGTYQLDITDNHCFGSVENMKRYALDILNKYADYNAVVKLRAKCDPALQLGDVVQLALPNYTGRYTIRGIETQLTADGLSTTLTLNLLVAGEVGPFILDQSQLDGADLLG